LTRNKNGIRLGGRGFVHRDSGFLGVKKDFDVTAAYLFSLRLQLADERF